VFIALAGEFIVATEKGTTESLPHEVLWVHSVKYSGSKGLNPGRLGFYGVLALLFYKFDHNHINILFYQSKG